MASIDEAMRLIWNLSTIDDETATFRIHCARKAGGLQSFIHGAMEDFYSGLISGAYAPIGNSTLTDTRVLEWNDTLGQFVQTSVSVAVALSSASNILPAQVAAVLTLKAEQPFGGRRQSYQNRAFLGPIRAAQIDADGKMIPLSRTATLDAVEQLQDDLQTIDNFSGVTFTDGLCIVSETLLEANAIVEANIGNVLDTQRRRRRGLTETRSSTIDL